MTTPRISKVSQDPISVSFRTFRFRKYCFQFSTETLGWLEEKTTKQVRV